MDNDILFSIKELHLLIGKAMFLDSKKMPLYKPTSTQIRFIDYLEKHCDEDITGHDLEKAFNISKATVSDVLNTMEKHKIIIRVVNSEDTRAKKIILNKEYKELHSALKLEINKMNQIIKNGISKEEQDLFNEVLNKMKNNVCNFLKSEKAN